MNGAQKANHTLSIFLVKEGITGVPDIVSNAEAYDSHPVRAGRSYLGVLVVQPRAERLPRWTQLFASQIRPEDLDVATRGSAAVLLVERQSRTFALTFGHGRFMLKPGVWEENFGLRTTLNAIAHDKIRTIDRKTFEAVSIHSREQTSRETGIEGFGLNIEQDLLRAVTGTPIDQALGSRLTGMDSLSVTLKLSLQDLPDVLDRYLKVSQDDKYRIDFPWVDQMAEVRDRHEIERLNAGLVVELASGDLDRVWIAPPEILDWAQIAGFRYRGARDAQTYSDLKLADYFADRRDREEVSIELLRHDQAVAIGVDGHSPLHKWSVLKCLYAEVDLDGNTFVLNGGSWFRVHPTFVGKVNAVIERLPATGVVLPEYDDTSEPAYNKRVAAANPEELVLLDQVLIPCGPPRGNIEFCDLFSIGRVMVYVKRYGGSSVLSHLFGQGLVGSTMLVMDSDFRRALADRLPASHRRIVSDNIDARQFEIAYAIVSRSRGSLTLPFFSRVYLKAAVDRLRPLGFNVTLTKIQAR